MLRIKLNPQNLPNNGESCTCIIPKKNTPLVRRQIGVPYSGLQMPYSTITFDDVEQIEKKDNRLQTAIDVVREQFGFLLYKKGNSS